MSAYLLVIFALTVAYLIYFALGRARTPAGQAEGKAVTALYVVGSTLAIVTMLLHHLAFTGPEAADAARHVEFQGVSATVPMVGGVPAHVRITGDLIDADSEVKRGFRWYALPAGSWVDVRPTKVEKNRVSEYAADAHGNAPVLRLNGNSINQPAGGWIASGAKCHFIFIRTSPDQKPRAYRLMVQVEEDAVLVEGGRQRVRLMDRLSLRDVLRRAGANDSLTALTSLFAEDEINLDRLVLVRQARNRQGSAVGLVGVDPESPAQQNISAPDERGERIGVTASITKEAAVSGTISAGEDGQFILTGVSNRERHSLRLPSEIVETEEGSARLRVMFDPPRAFPLPPAELLKMRGNKLTLASGDIGQTTDGYVFDTGNLVEAVVTNVQFSPDRRSWKIPRGLNADGTLGTGGVVPILALVDPFESRPSWIWPVAAVLIGFFCCMLSFAPGFSRRKLRLAHGLYQTHPAFVLWVVAAAILAVRVVMAYRASLLPPFNMDSLTAKSYQDTWPRAMAGMGLVVILGIVTPVVVWAKESGWTPKWAAKVADTSSQALHRIALRPWQALARWLQTAALVLVAFQAAHRLIPAIPDASLSLYAILLMILGLVLEGVGHARDEQFEGEERETLESKAKTALSYRPTIPRWLQIAAPAVVGLLLLIFGGLKALILLLAIAGIGFLLPRGVRTLGLTAVLLVLADAGTFIFFVPFVVALCAGGLVLQLRSGASGRSWVPQTALVAILVLTIAGIGISSRVGGSLLTGSPLGTLVSNSPVPYRLAATDAGYAENLLLEPKTSNGIFSTIMLGRTLHQRWQMLAYVKAAPLGYFQAPITNVGMTYGTVLSDAAYSVLLVGEHGPLAGVLVVGLWVALAFALIRAAWAAACSRNQRANARGLYAIGAVLGAAAVYMALANIWQVPFVGQNLPFLALNSMRDLVFNGLLLIAALLLIAFPGSWSSQIDSALKGQSSALRALWWAFPALLVVGCLSLAFGLASNRTADKAPFNYRTATLDAIEQKLRVAARELGEETKLGNTHPVKNGSRFLKEIAARFDEGDVSNTPVVAGRTREDLSLDRRFFRLNSPLAQEDGVPWHGSLTAAGAVRRHQLFVGGSRVPVILEQNAGPAWITMGRRFPAMQAQTISLRGPRGREEDYGGIKLDNGKIFLRWNTHLKEGRILVNGEVPAGRLNEVQLQDNDTVSLEYEGDEGVSQRLSVTYPGPSEANLGRVLWRNGRYSRSYPQGRDFPLAYSIALVADENQRKADKQIGDVKLSLDLQLQRDMQERLRTWARAKNRLVDQGRQRPDGLPFTAVAVLDSHTGQVRGLASLPQVDPNDDIQLLARNFPNERQAYTAARSSWALENRTIGSSVKPITFAALCAQLSPNFDLTKLRVNEVSAVRSLDTDEGTIRSYRQLGDILLDRGRLVSSRENPRSEVDMAEYLRDSRTWPAIVTATIGLVADSSASHVKEQKRELAAMLKGSGVGFQSGDFRPKSALSRLMSPRGSLSSVELADTALFKGLEEAYGPSVVPFNIADQNRWEDGMESGFLKPLKLAPDSNLKSFVLPEPHWADTTLLTDLDKGLLRYMIGGGECKWNALTMAANAARLSTGKRVQPTLSAAKPEAAKDMPAPINRLEWREKHLLQPLSSISTLGSDRGELTAMASRAGYRLIMKTGTIDDGQGKRALESEMILFTIGRFDSGRGFLPGQTLSGFLSIRSSKRAENREAVKADLMREVLPLLIRHLKKPAK